MRFSEFLRWGWRVSLLCHIYWSFPSYPSSFFFNNNFYGLLKNNQHVNTKNKQNQFKSPVHTLFFSVFILCLLLLAAGPSPSGAALGCSSPSPVTWACWVQLGGVPIDQKGLVPTELFTPGYPSCRDRHENLEQYYVLVPCLSRQGFILSGPGCLPWPGWKPTCHGKQCTGRMLCIWQSLGSLLSPMV